MIPVAIPVALASVLVLVGTATFAQSATQHGGSAIQQSPSSLVQAIGMAEQETGGRARKAEIERERGIAAYEIKTLGKDKSAKVLVDPASGKVVRVERSGFFDAIANLFDGDDRRKDQAALAQLEASPITLAAAVAAAERETGGRAVKASLKNQYGQTLFEVGVVKDLVAHKVVVDPASGKVATVAQSKSKDDD